MLIEEFYRMGRALLSSEVQPISLLEQVTDVCEETVKNFYRNVFVVELPHERHDKVLVQYQVFGAPLEKGDFATDVMRAVGIPFSLPAGGNPLQAQGRYGLPIYPCYDPHLRSFKESAAQVRKFLDDRLERTPGVAFADDLIDNIAERVHQCVSDRAWPETKVLGVLVLADCRPEGFYWLEKGHPTHRVGISGDGRSIVPNHARILEAVLEARVEEGRQAGTRQGRCSFSGEEGELVSSYCKAWPWALPTWTCPLPHGGDEDSLIESIALSPTSYRALTVGACVFDKLSRPLAREVIPEIFSPADTRGGKDQAQQRKLSALPTVQGSALMYSLREDLLDDADACGDYARGIWGLLKKDLDRATEADRYIESVVGFQFALPRHLRSDYRLALVYFSGSTSRGDIHLRSTIQDILPGTVTDLKRIADRTASEGIELLGKLPPRFSEKQRGYFARRYSSVPYLLTRAYGGGYLWQQMEMVLHRRPLGARRIIANAARRMESLTPRWPGSRIQMLDEVGFLLHMRRFVERVNNELAKQSIEDSFMPTRVWKELIEAYVRSPVEVMSFGTIAELGFACGLMVRRFSGWYRFVLGNDKDFLRDRVLTFGASLSPHDVWKRAINGICDTSPKYPKLNKAVELGQLHYYESKEERREHLGDYRRRLSAVQSELERRKDDLDRYRDEFMTGFWSGYGLLDHDRKRQPKKAIQTTTP